MSTTFCKINVKHVQDNKYVNIKYKLNKLTGVYTSYKAGIGGFSVVLKVTRQQVCNCVCFVRDRMCVRAYVCL